jgi:hypothetical protein
VEKAPRFQSADTWAGFAVQTSIGVAGVTVTAWLLWRVLGRRLWARAA